MSSFELLQANGALLFVVDRSAFMKPANKWGVTGAGLISALGSDAFDSLSLGLLAYPSGFAAPPQCLCDFIESSLGPGQCGVALPQGVACGLSGSLAVAIAPSGLGAFGVREEIYDFLTTHAPVSDDDNGAPGYGALDLGYAALLAEPVDRRAVALLADSGFNCTANAEPARAGSPNNAGCADWEYPSTTVTLIHDARVDPAKPIPTFVIGLLGSDSVGLNQGGFETPPYDLKVALAQYALAGAPEFLDASCAQEGSPTFPCHFDLSDPAVWGPEALATAVRTIRRRAFGCVYDLPSDQLLDLSLINVRMELEGASTPLLKRMDLMDTCAADGCWDYDVSGRVALLGKACDDLSAALSVHVTIDVGCPTVTK